MICLWRNVVVFSVETWWFLCCSFSLEFVPNIDSISLCTTLHHSAGSCGQAYLQLNKNVLMYCIMFYRVYHVGPVSSQIEP